MLLSQRLGFLKDGNILLEIEYIRKMLIITVCVEAQVSHDIGIYKKTL